MLYVVFYEDTVGEDLVCKICASVAYDVIEVKLSRSQDPSQSVTVHLTYTDLQCCVSSQVALSCGQFSLYYVTLPAKFIENHYTKLARYADIIQLCCHRTLSTTSIIHVQK